MVLMLIPLQNSDWFSFRKKKVMSLYRHAQSDVPYIEWHNWPAGRRYWAAWLDDLLIYLASLVGRSDTWNTKENWLYNIQKKTDYTIYKRKLIIQYTRENRLYNSKENRLYNINIIRDTADFTNIFSKFITEYLFFKHIDMNINIISNVADFTNIFSKFITEY